MAYDLLLERFLRYVKINTRSDENATRTPTTQSQVDFALKVLKPELEELGLSNIHYLESNGYLVATLPANDDQLTRKIGFISHMDTLILMQRECHRKSLTLMMEVSFLLEIQVIT